MAILKANENIGQTLPLRCPRHPDNAIEVSTQDDFLRLAPEGLQQEVQFATFLRVFLH